MREVCDLLTDAGIEQDNGKPHMDKKTKNNSEELDGAKVPPHPAYSPNFAPSDYGLFDHCDTF
ncbi:hypothetical protein KIN20_031964 [Parelaphostrongylus tenuis]|uniref:Uncharacterized protein n=1 Tax=Parelaphostrongylus tenuis TaxID=148309 RepID=A0AAD5R6C8_PARTN|nr:hypothetical protein KIN20_031964 [Parelaphostrongylus tenuis]